MKAKDLAKLLEVSPATISLVLNNKPGLSESLRKKLTDQIIELGYGDMLQGGAGSSGSSARSSSTSSTSGSGQQAIVYLSYYGNGAELDGYYNFYSGVLEGAQQEARESDYNMIVIYRQCENNLARAIRRAGNVIGIVVACHEIKDEMIAELDAIGLPYVFIDAFDPNQRVNAVNVDDRQSFYMSVDYVKRMGHTRVGYVINACANDSSEERRISFRRAMKDVGLKEYSEYYFYLDDKLEWHSTKALEEQLQKVADTGTPLPSVLLTENDAVAMKTIAALRHLGLRVPDDISVVGFDDNPISRITDPPLTTVRSSRHRIGRECVALIQRLIKLQETDTLRLPMKISISTELVERGSVKNLNS